MSGKRLPSLERMLAKLERRGAMPEQEGAAWIAWAHSHGFKVEKHDKPILPVF